MRLGARLKHWFFGAYWVLALLFGGALGVAFLFGTVELDQLAAGLGLLLPFVYFVQKQKLEELHLFRDLFSGFNERYDDLNEKLNRILRTAKSTGEEAPQLTETEKETLIDYFNLCSEEFLYYRRGYVYPEVWGAWLNGMLVFYSDERIRPFWDRELKTGSYYDLGDELVAAYRTRKGVGLGSGS